MTNEGQSRTYPVLSLIILLLLTFIIGNLIYNIQYLDIPPETRLPYPVVGGGEAALFEVGDSGEALRWFFIAVLVLLTGVAIVGLIVSAVMRKSIISRREIVGYLAVTAFLVVFFLALPDIINSIRGLLGGGYESADGDGNTGTGGVANVGFGFPIGGILILVMALVVVIYFAISRTLASMRTEARAKDIEKDKSEMLRYVEDAIVDLESGGDPREVIIRCYRNLCALLGGRGIALEPHLTPREFERLAVERTGLKGRNLSELTSLFEEARYSTHELTSLEREKAVGCLKDFKSDVEGIGGDGSYVHSG